MSVIEVPPGLALDARLPDETLAAGRLLDEARARRSAPGRREIFGTPVGTVLRARPCRVFVAARGAA